MRQCSKCKEWKNGSEFNKGKNKDGLRSICKKCQSRDSKIYRENMKIKNRQLSEEDAYKKVKRCIKCREWKNGSEFNKNDESKDKLCNRCRECDKINGSENRKNNKERENYRARKYYQNNIEYTRIRNKKRHTYSLEYDTKSKLKQEIEKYEEIKESKNGNIECKCAYCNDWFEPTRRQIQNRVDAINGKESEGAEERLYCSDKCKENCPIYQQHFYPKGQKPATSREVQPQLRQLVFERDNYTCQKCNTHKDNLEVGIHCHHIEPLNENPVESADKDNCITLCEDCHKEVHSIPGCTYSELRCKSVV